MAYLTFPTAGATIEVEALVFIPELSEFQRIDPEIIKPDAWGVYRRPEQTGLAEHVIDCSTLEEARQRAHLEAGA